MTGTRRTRSATVLQSRQGFEGCELVAEQATVHRPPRILDLDERFRPAAARPSRLDGKAEEGAEEASGAAAAAAASAAAEGGEDGGGVGGGGRDVLPVWAWRYGKDRNWKSVRECKITLEHEALTVTNGARVLQRIAYGDVQMTYNYVTSARLIISSRAGVAMFLSLDKNDHQTFMKMLQKVGLPSREVSYGEFFRQQKWLTFPDLPQEPIASEIAEANAPPPQQQQQQQQQPPQQPQQQQPHQPSQHQHQAQPHQPNGRGRVGRVAAEQPGCVQPVPAAAPAAATESALVQQLQQQLQELQSCNNRLTEEMTRLSGVPQQPAAVPIHYMPRAPPPLPSDLHMQYGYQR
eukprot:Rhum_TRINITY_DN14334_c9_g1::Rhum_TRINITY_DN14334_c9_g1_i2::g.81998::m.81998